MRKKLFQIENYTRYYGFINVDIEQNVYISDTITFHQDKFKEYLEDTGSLYYETHSFEHGSYESKQYTISFEEYFDTIDRSFIYQDLYDFICLNYLDIDRVTTVYVDNISNLIKNIKL